MKTLLLAAILGCGSHQATNPEMLRATDDKLLLRPILHAGDEFTFHVEISIDAIVTENSTAKRARAGLKLDDQVKVVSASEVRDEFSNVTADGEGTIGNELKRVATLLSSAIVTTHFDANWQVTSTSIDGIQDDEARTTIMNLTPMVSFRSLPPNPVAVGDRWNNRSSGPLRSERGTATGSVVTNMRYTLRTVSACGTRRCATITSDGDESIPPQDGMTGTSSMHGEVKVDTMDVVPLAKSIESKTTLHGKRHGQPFTYTNTVTVRVQRVADRVEAEVQPPR